MLNVPRGVRGKKHFQSFSKKKQEKFRPKRITIIPIPITAYDEL